MAKYKINWKNHENILDWKDIAEEKQKFYCAHLGKSKWELYNVNDLKYLKLKIGYSLFGPPTNVEEEDIEIIYRDPANRTKIDYIISAIKKYKHDNVLHVSFIYFIAIIENKYSEFPVIRVLNRREKGKDVCSFVDTLGYRYKTWEKFLYTNVMPKCIYCYPKNGFYTCDELGHVELDYSYSPQYYSNRSKNMIISIISVMPLVGTIVPGILQKSGGSSEAKAIMSESADKEVKGNDRNCGITVASAKNCSSLHAIHSTGAIAASLYELDKLNPFLAKILEKGIIRPNWFAVLNLTSEILKDTPRITYTHIAQLFVPILFFCHTVVSYDTCEQILKETLNDITNNIPIDLSDRAMNFLKEMKDNLVNKRIHESILLIKRIDKIADLCEEMLDKNEPLDENGNISIDDLPKLSKVASKENISPKQKIASYCFFLEQVTQNCMNCSEKIKQAEKYTHDTNGLSNIEPSMQEHEELEPPKKVECLEKIGPIYEVFYEVFEDGLDY